MLVFFAGAYVFFERSQAPLYESPNKVKRKKLIKLLKNMGYTVNIEVKNKEEVPKYIIFSDNDALLIGKNGKNLKALSLVVSGYLNKELGRNYKFVITLMWLICLG